MGGILKYLSNGRNCEGFAITTVSAERRPSEYRSVNMKIPIKKFERLEE
jgi:hypothetical protein